MELKSNAFIDTALIKAEPKPAFYFWFRFAKAVSIKKVIYIYIYNVQVNNNFKLAMLIKRNFTVENLVPLENVFLLFKGKILLGSSNKESSVIFDTGSCQMWVKDYDTASSTLFSTRNEKAPVLSYLDKTRVEGIFVQDSVAIGNVTIPNLKFEIAKNISLQSDGSDTTFGIIGLCHQSNSNTENFVDSAFRLGYISEKIASFSISKNADSAIVSFGSVDTTKFNGNMAWIPVDTSSIYWQTNLVSAISNDNSLTWNGNIKAVFDTGTSLLILPKDLSMAINNLFKFTLQSVQSSNLYYGKCPLNYPETIQLSFSGTSLTIFSRNLLYGDGTTCFSSVVDGDANVAIIGNGILRNFYTAFNYNNHSVGFATNLNNDSGTVDKNNFFYQPNTGSDNSLKAIVSIFGVIIVVMAIAVFFFYRKKNRN